LTAGNPGFAGAKFQPTSGGAATHVVMKMTLPQTATNIHVFSCPGTAPAITSQTVECDVSSVANLVTVKFVVTFTATGSGPGTVTGTVSWDNGNGSNGTQNLSQPASPTGSFTVYPTTDTSHTGNCTAVGGTLPTIVDSGTGKGANKDTYNTTTQAGLPCTFAQVSIDDTGAFPFSGALSKGHWSIVAGQSSGLNSVTLTTNSAPGSWKSVVLYEIFPDGSTDPVPLCKVTNGVLSIPTAVPPAQQHLTCLNPTKPQASFGQGGVQWFVYYAGTGTDPSTGY
jgi:hypothetical protein